jgi:predicted nucleotidyltransferase
VQAILTLLRRELPRLRRAYEVEELGIFGSYARHDERTTSDLDILVTFAEPPSLLRLIEFEHELSELTGLKVDLVRKESG